MIDGFLMRAGLGGLGLVLATAPLGCFVIWRRMAYFGDALSHAAILGVALALAVQAPIMAGVLVVALLFGLAVLRLMRAGDSADTSLGVLSHGALATGLVAVALLPNVRVDMEALLLGDILTVRWSDLVLIWGGGALVAGVLRWRWDRLLTASLGPDLARASGIDPDRESVILTVLLALTVALALKIVGALLVSALLILPAATARHLSRSPETMAIMALALGAAAVLGGLGLSYGLDTPAGPSIITVATALFALARVSRKAA
ncbi:metal ABC transporter permease [Palleronia caenipelagi]|uniref:High-affinity zinc uptake system membrane protein ZnuB n=1 Tax=Palleronia caenipelagi TaxID=2489174 RepID=A0A547PXX8_9RHOB|nr:metal ABC transporter permease [Palleronia caenipelagi]TRD18959.1 hypothetical protein FEV53_11410 [Palleronia caenipelagi]